MQTERRWKPVSIKIFCGLIGEKQALTKVDAILCEHFGKIDLQSEIIRFDVTDYYAEEMGKDLYRKWIGFGGLRQRGFLPLAKHIATLVENDLRVMGRRTVNIDPGYVDNAQVVLATRKNYAHRIYIGMGYFAEVALIFRNGQFRTLEWTYPDYRSDEALRFFTKAREIYRREVASVET
ncbi:MAG: DUF4416 family protein [bacterium]